jgi:hypothetical protein
MVAGSTSEIETIESHRFRFGVRLTHQPLWHRQARQLKNPCRSKSAPAAMTAINTSLLNVSGAILSHICCPTYKSALDDELRVISRKCCKSRFDFSTILGWPSEGAQAHPLLRMAP